MSIQQAYIVRNARNDVQISGFAPGSGICCRAIWHCICLFSLSLSFLYDKNNMESLEAFESRPVRRKFSRPPVKVACLSWYVYHCKQV